MSFHIFVDDDKLESVEFEFDINDPLYFCISRFLGDDNEIVIDDDDTAKTYQKYMTIKKENNIFKIIFVNKNSEDKWDLHKFDVFIKNIGPDHRSKITDDSFKFRIVKFFRDMEKHCLNNIIKLLWMKI